MLTLKVKVGARAGSGNLVVALKGSTSLRYCTLHVAVLHVNEDTSCAIPDCGSRPHSSLGPLEEGAGQTATFQAVVDNEEMQSHQG